MNARIVIGAGLLLAGMTGFCGMARALAVLPWNKTPSRPGGGAPCSSGCS